MEDRRIISVVARLPKTTTDSVWQHSYGLILQISGIALPETFEAHFCNEGDKETKTQYGTNGQVKIPAQYLATGKNIRCYIYMHDEASDGRTVRMITIPVEKRERPSADEPTPEEADTITLDRRSGTIKELDMRELIFVNWRTGLPAKSSSYDTHLYKLCDEAGIKRFSMHALRHTYATRAIERGVPPKTLQKLLGHASIKTTMDRYVHLTDESLRAGVDLFESCVKVV